ncbi:efflux RND transporter periplasmic adaptor subunit [Halosquirtibacter xylanolyticus]|uniref:efflux RND transporter periplasmic adaptor subunit n=1 Tax=Halosquirtibacter xylanolyticus TaxID=3374599 RepID=UPI0037496B24|nr:efflux RND transporter periplasmic adaptor subunit [Prolixibacteraceae bacterium]
MDRVIEKRWKFKMRYVVMLFVMLVIALTLYRLFWMEHMTVYKERKDRLITSQVSQGHFNDYISVNAKVAPISTIILDARIGGRVEAKYVEEGTMIEKGAVILKMSNPDLHQSILNSEAQLAEKSNFLRNTMVTMEQEKLNIKKTLLTLEFEIKNRQRKWEQNRFLFQDSLISKDQYIDAKEAYDYAVRSFDLYKERQCQDSIYRTNQLEQMNRSLDNMRENLKLVQQRKNALEVKAPISGQLTTLDVEVGQSVMKGRTLGQVDILSDFKIVTLIDEHYIDKVHVGQEASLKRGDMTFKLKVRKVYPEVKEGKFKTELLFVGEKPERLRRGQSYYIDLRLGEEKSSLLVERGPFYLDCGGNWVYVLSEDGNRAIKREVKLGRQNPEYYEVVDGLKEGETIIISPYQKYGSSELLKLIN